MYKSKKIAVFCTNHHHEEKALFLQKHFNTRINIFNKELNLIKGKSQIDNKEIFRIVENHHAFIFFTLLPNKWTLRLIKNIKESKKIIAVFQESLQLSIHDNEVNNIIFKPDLLIAASEEEKKRLEQISHYRSSEIVSFGWIFNSEVSKISVNKQLEPQNIPRSILLVLSAPNYLTFSSHESKSIRKKLILSIVCNYPNHNLIIRPHPNEEIDELEILVNSLKIQNLKLKIIRSNDEYFEAIKSASSIFISNRTQAIFDLVDTNKVTLYMLGNENFISKHALKFSHSINTNGIEFVEFTDQESIKQFNSKYTNKNIKDIKKIEALIINRNFCEKFDHELEIILWEIVLKRIPLNKFYGTKVGYKLFNNDELSSDQFFQYLLNDFMQNQTLSIRTSLFIIIARIAFQSDLYKHKQFICLLEQNFNEWFIQYFIHDAIYIRYQCKKKDVPLKLSKRSIELLDQAMINLSSKSKVFSMLAMALDYAVTENIRLIKNFFFYIAIRVLSFIRYLVDS